MTPPPPTRHLPRTIICKDIFFFQAEDGIRDGRVTGVQTCALPIYRRARSQPSDEIRREHRVVEPDARVDGGQGDRSGEGRGGEEGRVWGGADHWKKKRAGADRGRRG